MSSAASLSGEVVPGVYRFADTCNVYVLRSGRDAVLIDFGSGAVLDRLCEIGVELHLLLQTVYDAAKRAKANCLVVPQMRHRARIVAAVCPELPIDTDDWAAPDRDSWRRLLEIKPELGVPALYYVSHIDRSGERLGPDDYEALRRTSKRWGSMQRARAAS